jgi:hypothetical protein
MIKKKWSPTEISVLKQMSDMGMNSQEISKILGRTQTAVAYQKSAYGIRQNKSVNFTGLGTYDKDSVEVKESPVEVKESPRRTKEISGELKNPMRNPSKEITRIARQIARENGKRITMAMFFIEDLN